MKTFREFLNERQDKLDESVNSIQERFKVLILNSYLYKQSLNEKFIETNTIKGKTGLESKYAIQYNKSMKNRSLKSIEDFQDKNIDNLSKLYSQHKKIFWHSLTDKEFVENLDSFLLIVFNTLSSQIYRVNNFQAKTEFEDFEKVMNINTLKRLVQEYLTFRTHVITILNSEVQEEYDIVIGVETSRIKKQKDRIIPDITIDYDSLEESFGCDTN